MGEETTIQSPATSTLTRQRYEDMFEVVLFDDTHNTMDHVVNCLMKVFGHPRELAVRIMFEAHAKGQAIAEVECESDARLHRDQLTSFGLTVTLEKV